MSRLKKRKVINKPSYNPKESTFEFELEKITVKEGFKNTKGFVRDWINKGGSLLSLQRYVEEKYGFKTYKETFRKKIKKFAPSTYNIHTVGYYKRRAEATRKGYLRSVNCCIRILSLRGKGKIEIAELLKTTTLTLAKNKHLHPININNLFPDKVKLGMKDFKDYYRWLQNARKIGFESVVEAIEYLLIEKKLSMRDTAWVFQVTAWRMRVRISKCMYLREKLNLSSKKGRKKNGCKTTYGTNV